MTRRTLRLYILTVLAAAALGLSPAAAQTLTTVSIDPAAPDIELSGSIAGTVATATLNAILTDEEATAASVLATLNDSLIGLTASVATGGTLSFLMNANFISGVGTGNDAVNAIGLLPAPGVAGINGGAILGLQVSDTTALSVVLDGDDVPLEIVGTVSGAGDASGEFLGNSVFAFGAYNQALGTIETVSYPDLVVPAASGLFDRSDPTMPSQSASLSVMSVQQAYAFDSTPLTDQPNVSVLDGNIGFERSTPAGPNTTVDGNYLLAANSFSAEAFGNRSDNSILLRREITYIDDQGTPLDPSDDTTETLVGSLVFEGTAIASNLQTTGDAVASANLLDPGNGVGIDSLAFFNNVRFLFYQGDQVSQADGFLVADGLNLSVTGNAIAARTALNAARNQVFFDAGIALDGVLQDPATDVIVIDDGVPERTQADYQVNNVQIAGTVDDPQLHQAASATADDNSLLVSVEDVDDASVLSIAGNLIAAEATGNAALNLVGNGTDQATTSVDGVAASSSTQFIFEPEIEATLSEAGITVNVGSGFSDAIGGFEGSALTIAGNALSAAARGNTLHSEIAFQAQSLALEIDEGPASNVGALIFSQDGTVTPALDYSVSAGASTLAYQVLDGEGPDFELEDLSILATADGAITAGLGVGAGLGGDPIDGLSGSIALSDNSVLAAAYGNDFTGLTLLEGGSFSGTAGSLVVQRNEGQSAGAETSGSVFMNAGFGTDAGPLAVTVEGSALQALATLNRAETVIGFAGGAFLGGAEGTGDNVALLGSDDNIDFGVPLRSSIQASAALLAVSDQVSLEGDALAQADGARTFAGLSADGGATLDDLALAVTGNSILAQARINDAGNTILLGGIEAALDPSSVTTAAAGAVAGIVSRQVNTHLAPGDPPPVDPGLLDPLNGPGAVAVAELYDGQVGVVLQAIGSGTVEVSGNRMVADAGANAVRNAIVVEAQSLTQSAPAAGTSLSIEHSAALDVDLLVENADFFIVSSQRNEAVTPATLGDPAAPDTLGPAVVARAGGLDAGNQLIVAADLATGAVVFSDNDIAGLGTANSASNAIALAAQSAAVNAGILSNQVNSGDVLVTNEESAMVLLYNGGANVVLSLDRNRLAAEAAGNAVRNAIAVTGNGFSGPAAAEASIIPGDRVLNATPATAGGNLVILNAQTAYGIGGDSDPANITEIAARLDGTVPDVGLPLGNIVLSVPGDLTNATVSLDGNVVTASAVVNSASNEVTAQSAVGGLPSATILNQQQASGTSASASVADVTVSAQLGDVGLGTAITGGSVTVSGNQIGSAATINDARNTVGAPGQSFTRTSSF